MLRVYWQPGCTSCLRAREFLRQHGVPFLSVNVRDSDTARAELEALGVRTVPVVARGSEYPGRGSRQTSWRPGCRRCWPAARPISR
jgi:glutaredoxin